MPSVSKTQAEVGGGGVGTSNRHLCPNSTRTSRRNGETLGTVNDQTDCKVKAARCIGIGVYKSKPLQKASAQVGEKPCAAASQICCCQIVHHD